MNAASWIRGWEGSRLSAYEDTGGVWTIGVGHVGHDVDPGAIWTQARVDEVFSQDCDAAHDNAIRSLGHSVDALGAARNGVLQDMCFEMGLAGVEAFHDMLAALRTGAWSNAAESLLQSRYAQQSPRRANANAQILTSGEWPEVHPNDTSIS